MSPTMAPSSYPSGPAPGEVAGGAKTDENSSPHGKRVVIVAAVFFGLVIGGLAVDMMSSARKAPTPQKAEAATAVQAPLDPFSDFESRQRIERARLDMDNRKKARLPAGARAADESASAPRNAEQELRETARLDDLKRALDAVRSPDLILSSTRRGDVRSAPARSQDAGSIPSRAEATLTQLRQAIDRARAGGAGNSSAAGGVARDVGTAFSRELQGAEASTAVVGQVATARREVGEGARKGEFLVPVGTVMTAVLDMDINSDWEGRWRAMLTRDVYDVTRENILLPKGTRIIGATARQKPVNEAINSRMALTARWAVLPNGARIDFSRSGTLDESGIGAVEGDVDRHFLAQIGGVAAYGVIGGLGAVSAARSAAGSDPTQISFGATGAGAVASGLVDIGTRVASRYLNLVPTITVKAGTVMTIFLDDELYLLPWAPIDDSTSSVGMRYGAR